MIAGGMYLDPAIAGQGGGRPRPWPHRASRARRMELSERETDVLRMIAGGHSNKEISARLNISVKTVETYKARAMEKLAFAAGWTSSATPPTKDGCEQ